MTLAALPVSRLGFGTAAIAGLYSASTEEQAQSTMQAAWDAGVRYFDTAPHYGVGLAEERLGRFLAGRPRAELVVSTKVGRLLVPHDGPVAAVQGAEGFFGTPNRRRVRDYSRDGVRRSLAESLARLGLDRVDVLLVHDPEQYLDQALRETCPALAELRADGVVGAIGVGVNSAAVAARFVREADLDCVLVAGRYTLLDDSAADELLPLCAERGVDVVGAGVFNSGLLAAPRPGVTFDYAEASPELLDRVRRIARTCARHGTSLPAAAIAFALRPAVVRTVLLGMRSPAEVRENTAAAAQDVPDGLWADLAVAGLLPSRAGERS